LIEGPRCQATEEFGGRRSRQLDVAHVTHDDER
jgi:hypothetical protein